jgi:hypothetical protein
MRWLLVILLILLPWLAATGTIHTVPDDYTVIQDAIDQSSDGDTILVMPGSYCENISFRGKSVVLTSGYMFDRDLEIVNTTIIDGSCNTDPDTGSVVIFASGKRSDATLFGFTLTGGFGTAVPGSYSGGGILIDDGCSPTIMANHITGNSALSGAGIAVYGGAPLIAGNVISDNDAEIGGGVLIEGGTPNLSGNVLYQNHASSAAGALEAANCELILVNCALVENSAPQAGGLRFHSVIGLPEHCDFYANQNGDLVGAGSAEFGDTTWGLNFNRHPVDALGNLFRQPGFADPAGGDFTLKCTSFLIDAGTGLPAEFPRGGKRADIGAYEFPYRPGDLNWDNKVNLGDIYLLAGVVFKSVPSPCPYYVGDLDCSRVVNISDIVQLINYWTGYGPVPCSLSPE